MTALRRLGVVMDPIGAISYAKDSTLAMLLAAQARGFALAYLEQRDLLLRDGVGFGRMRALTVRADPADWFTLGEPALEPLSTLECILMRKDPPFDTEYIYSTYILERAEAQGVLIVNRPRGLRYIPDIVESGDSRVLLIDGEPVPYALARIPSAQDHRGNLAAGARGVGRPLNERDRWLAGEIGPALAAQGMLFVGLDVIGGFVTEINVTSPTGIRELEKAFGIRIGDLLMAAIERRLADPAPRAASSAAATAGG